jgi:hypothetical protein
MPTAFGDKIVISIFSPKVLVRNFNDPALTTDDSRRR